MGGRRRRVFIESSECCNKKSPQRRSPLRRRLVLIWEWVCGWMLAFQRRGRNCLSHLQEQPAEKDMRYTCTTSREGWAAAPRSFIPLPSLAGTDRQTDRQEEPSASGRSPFSASPAISRPLPAVITEKSCSWKSTRHAVWNSSPLASLAVHPDLPCLRRQYLRHRWGHKGPKDESS